MRSEYTTTEATFTFDSIEQLYSVASKHHSSRNRLFQSLRYGWHGVDSVSELETLAITGWQAETDTALDIAEETIANVEREHNVPSFRPYLDVAGSEVDVGRYLAGEPENMIEYELAPTTKAGRVVVLCASVSYSGSVSVESIKQRGYMITALAFALTRLGHSVELWADMSATAEHTMRIRTLVKGANDELDPAKIMFAYCHASMLRMLKLGAMHELPKERQSKCGVGSSYGAPTHPKQDLPEGAIYLPSVRRGTDMPDPKDDVARYLAELGIIDESETQ